MLLLSEGVSYIYVGGGAIQNAAPKTINNDHSLMNRLK